MLTAEKELWRVQTADGVQEIDLATLKSWINAGAVLPHDKVTKGNRAWLEAGRVPVLQRTFSGEEALDALLAGESLPNVALPVFSAPLLADATLPSVPNTPQVAPVVNSTAAPSTFSKPVAASAPAKTLVSTQSEVETCAQHTDQKPQYICSECQVLQCRTCIKLLGGIAICGACGAMCREYAVVQAKVQRAAQRTAGLDLADVGRALIYPAQGGLIMIFAAFFYAALYAIGWVTWVFSFGLLFGYVSRTIRQVSWGRRVESATTQSLDFSFADDIIAPFGRGVCVLLVSWGPLALLGFMLFTGLVGSYDRQGDAKKQAEDALKNEAMMRQALDRGRPDEIAAAAKEVRNEINNLSSGSKTQSDGVIMKDMVTLINSHATPNIIIVSILALVWGIFYYPVALMVSGHTESATATLNPLVGLDTVRHLGLDYVLVFVVYLAVMGLYVFLSSLMFQWLAPFDLPLVGNVLGRFADGVLTFYANLVIACGLGLTLYKCAGKLGLAHD